MPLNGRRRVGFKRVLATLSVVCDTVRVLGWSIIIMIVEAPADSGF
jgi:hypothetical protein